MRCRVQACPGLKKNCDNTGPSCSFQHQLWRLLAAGYKHPMCAGVLRFTAVAAVGAWLLMIGPSWGSCRGSHVRFHPGLGTKVALRTTADLSGTREAGNGRRLRPCLPRARDGHRVDAFSMASLTSRCAIFAAGPRTCERSAAATPARLRTHAARARDSAAGARPRIFCPFPAQILTFENQSFRRLEHGHQRLFWHPAP